jgi:hypothetical protein
LAILFSHRVAGTANHQLELSSFSISAGGTPSLIRTVAIGEVTDWVGQGDLILSRSGNLVVLATGPYFTYSTDPATLKIYSYDSGLNPWGSSGNVVNIPINVVNARSAPIGQLWDGISLAETTLNHFVASWADGNYAVNSANIYLTYSGATMSVQSNINAGQGCRMKTIFKINRGL